MASPTWANNEELDWLTERLPRFLDHQKRKKVQSFFRTLYTEWDARYPECTHLFLDIELMAQLTPEQEVELTEAISLRQRVHYVLCIAGTNLMGIQQLNNWYNNRKPKGHSADKSVILKDFIPKDADHVKHLPQAVEVYSHLYYKEKVKVDIDAEIKEKDIKNGKVVTVVRHLTQKRYEAETPEVHAEIAAEVKWMKAQHEAEKAQTEEVHAHGEFSPAEYQRMLYNMPATFDQFLGAMVKATDGGNLWSMVFHSAEGSNDVKFSNTVPEFEAHFIEPFGQFLTIAFPMATSREVTPITLDDIRYQIEDNSDTEDRIPCVEASSLSGTMENVAHTPVTTTESGITAKLSTSSEAMRTLTTISYTHLSLSASQPSVQSSPAHASSIPSSSRDQLSASANTALAWVPNPGVWQFDPPEPAFKLEPNLQPMSLDSAMLGTVLDRMGSVSQMTGLGSQKLAYALSGPSGSYSATSDVAHPEVVSSGASSSPSFAAQSSSSPTEAASSVSPAESLSRSFPATRSSSRSATPAVTSATTPPLLVSSAHPSSLPSHQELNSTVESADIAPPSITVASANVDTGPACKHHQGQRHAVPVILAATETVNAGREDGALAAKSGRPA
ncbi:hypothetical protein SCP_1701830 [Sparassis crispa]|uniref:Uncharacterized protein n=1 Tax=Sparassis crispa TaxID=139825 RepID=A0A401H5Z1_9APHY|nr:hypothetical protein SCP_1701830 [Sparassis crispa]GBE89857.1 hypothetical protein SCP_1701830 [Sparassis crispa]